MRARAHIWWLLVAVLGAGPLARPAFAEEPAAATKLKAKARIKKARAAYEAGNFDQAVAEYQAAYKLMPLPDILFNLGQIQRVKDDKPAALTSYRKYVADAPDGGHAEEARGYIAQLVRTILPEALRARYEALEEKVKKKAPALDDKWEAVNAQIATGDTAPIGGQLDELEQSLAEKPKPHIEPETEKRAVAKVAKTRKPSEPFRPNPIIKKWWFWTAIGGGAAVVLAIAVGASVGTQDRNPLPTLGVLK